MKGRETLVPQFGWLVEVSHWRLRSFTHEGCIVRSMDDCNLNHTHLCKGLLEEDRKMLQSTAEIVISLPDFLVLSSHGSNAFSPEVAC